MTKEDREALMLPYGDELLDRKGLATALLRSLSYVDAMTRDGFLMPGNRATLNQAILWLAENPNFRQRSVRLKFPRPPPN